MSARPASALRDEHETAEPAAGLLVNDDCADATVVGNGATAFTTIGATTDGPAEPANCLFNGDPHLQADIWFRYTATCDGTVTVDLCPSAFDTKIAIYDDTCPIEPGTAIACNDDHCAEQSLVSFEALEGEQFLIRVGGVAGEQGSGMIVIGCQPDDVGCSADLDGDNGVDVSDILILIGAWGLSDHRVDINGDGIVNVPDLLALLSSWGPCD
jgi:hypothetical protein